MKTQTLEIGLSTFHKLMFTVLKMRFEKPKLKNVVYRDYKNFSNERLRLDFLFEIEKYHDRLFNDFHFAFTNILGINTLH